MCFPGRTVALSDTAEGCSPALTSALDTYLAEPCADMLARVGAACVCQAPANYNYSSVVAGIEFHSPLPQPTGLSADVAAFVAAANYTIHAPSSTHGLLAAPRFLPFDAWGPNGDANWPTVRELEFFQLLADRLLIAMSVADPALELHAQVQDMPYEAQRFQGTGFYGSQVLLLFYPMMILAMGGLGVASVIMKERELKLDNFLFVAGIRESVYWLSWLAYGLFRFSLSFALLLILLVAVPLFPDTVDTGPLVLDAFLTSIALVVYSLLCGATNDSVGFVSGTFILLLEAQAAVSFLWHYDVVGGEFLGALAYVFSVLSAPFGMGLLASIMFRGVLSWGFQDFGWHSLAVQTPYGASLCS